MKPQMKHWCLQKVFLQIYFYVESDSTKFNSDFIPVVPVFSVHIFVKTRNKQKITRRRRKKNRRRKTGTQRNWAASHPTPFLVCGVGGGSLYFLSVQVQCCFTSTETIQATRDGEPRTATLTFTQLPGSDFIRSL